MDVVDVTNDRSMDKEEITPEAAERPVALEEEEDILKAEKRLKAPEDPPIWDTKGAPEDLSMYDDFVPDDAEFEELQKLHNTRPPGYWLNRMEEEYENFINENKEAARKGREAIKKREAVLKKLIQYGLRMHWHMVVEENSLVELPESPESWPRKSLPQGCVDLKFGYYPDIWRIQDFGDHGIDTLPNTIQIYKLKIASNLYPFDVYGQMTLYVETNKPQMLFFRDRDHPQTITETDPYLLLTGPCCPPYFFPPGVLCLIKARLILKGTTRSHDKYLTLSTDVGVDYQNDRLCPDDVSKCCDSVDWCNPGKPYYLELTHDIVIYSVVATISVELLASSSLDTGGYYFTAFIDKLQGKDQEVVLLDSRHGKDAVLEDNKFKLSRETICVENGDRLMLHIEHDNFSKHLEFPHAAVNGGIVHETVSTSSSTIRVNVEWLNYDKLFKLSPGTCYETT